MLAAPLHDLERVVAACGHSSQAAASGCGGAALYMDVPAAYEVAVYVACFAAE
jgi:hypothetical protein